MKNINNIFYEKAADGKNYMYSMFWPSMKECCYSFFGPHIHKSIEMVVCVDGEMEYIINEEKGTIGKGDVLLINSYDTHFYKYVNDSSVYIFVFSLNLVDDVLEDRTKEFNNVVHLPNAMFEHFLFYIREFYPMLEQYNDLEKKGFSLALFGLLSRSGFLYRPKQYSVNKNIASEIMEYIGEHYAEELDLESVAKHFGYNRNYFSSMFNRIIGVSFTAYVNSFRMDKVMEMKRDPNNSGRKVEDIIRSCGFSSSETYYRTYRRMLNNKQEGI